MYVQSCVCARALAERVLSTDIPNQFDNIQTWRQLDKCCVLER